MLADFQEMFDEYAQLYPESQPPALHHQIDGAHVDPQFERREACLFADDSGGRLVNGNADANVGTGCLERLRSGEEGARIAGVVTGAVTVGAGVVLGEAAEHQHVLLVSFERFQSGRQFQGATLAGRLPLGHDSPVGEEDERHACRSSRRRGSGECGFGPHALEQRQRHRGAQALQKGSSL